MDFVLEKGRFCAEEEGYSLNAGVRVSSADRREGGRSRTDWASLLKRTLDIDVPACPKCPGRMVVVACITDPKAAQRILIAMGLWEEPPEAVPAHLPDDVGFGGRSPPEGEFESVHDR